VNCFGPSNGSLYRRNDLGYAATGFGWTPWNLYLFLFGLLGWFIVGIIWNDRAIMLIHIVALTVMAIGMSNV